jgi:beta-galactosidase GanA
VNAAVRTGFNADDIEEWGALLDAVKEAEAESGEDDEVFAGNWPGEGRTAYLTFIAEDPYVVEVHDAPSTQISVRVPLDLKADWIDQARERFGAARRALGA